MSDRAPNFLRSLSRVAWGRIDVLLASFAINLLTLALPLVILQSYDRIIPGNATETFAIMLAGLCVVVLVDFLLRVIRSRITTWTAARFEHSTGRRAIDRFLSARIESFESDPPGTHLDRISSIESLRDFHSGQSLITFADFPFVVLFLLLIYFIGGPLVLAPLGVAVAAIIFAVALAWRLDQAVLRRTELDNSRYNFIFQVLNGIHTVKGLGLEAQMCRQYEHIHAPIANAIQNLTFFSALAQSVGSMFGSITMVAVGVLGSVLVIQGELSNGALVASMLLAGRAVQPLLRMIGVWVQTRNLKLAEQRLNQLMTLPQEHKPAGDADKTPTLNGWIKFENVTVDSDDASHPILKDVSLEVLPGEMVALVGETGSGRSTLLDLVAGLSTPNSGCLRIDDVDTTNIDFQSLRGQIAYIRQFVVLYRGTIEENLTRFRGRENLASALEIAEKIGLDRVLAMLPDGLQTRVGDTASDALPGSLQQMISISRALATHPHVLLFDEANSALDFETDNRLRILLEELRGRMTILMVTGRPSLIKLADRVLTFEDGTIRTQQDGGKNG